MNMESDGNLQLPIWFCDILWLKWWDDIPEVGDKTSPQFSMVSMDAFVFPKFTPKKYDLKVGKYSANGAYGK